MKIHIPDPNLFGSEAYLLLYTFGLMRIFFPNINDKKGMYDRKPRSIYTFDTTLILSNDYWGKFAIPQSIFGESFLNILKAPHLCLGPVLNELCQSVVYIFHVSLIKVFVWLCTFAAIGSLGTKFKPYVVFVGVMYSYILIHCNSCRTLIDQRSETLRKISILRLFYCGGRLYNFSSYYRHHFKHLCFLILE